MDLAYHAKRVVEADLQHPVILGPCGGIIDGFHRVVKALVFGQKFVYAVRLEEMPEPDEIREES